MVFTQGLKKRYNNRKEYKQQPAGCCFFVRRLAMDLAQKTAEVRRRLHRLAETGFALHRTREVMMQLFGELGLSPVEVAKGITADFGHGERRVLLRADMDALPLQDGKDVPYKSQHDGACHACGHDAHMAMLYGAAVLLEKERVSGGIRYVLQPAEEVPPGGAIGMIEAGILDGIDMAFALHVAPWLPYGTVGIREGRAMAAADNFRLTIRGKSGHGAMPQDTVDALVAAAHVVVGLQSLVSRKADPLEPLVVTVGKISGGTACNIIADTVILEGTCRTLNPNMREKIPAWLKETTAGICAGFGASCELEYLFGYPVLTNSEEGVAVAMRAAAEVVGESNIISMDRPLMGGEDFAYILEKKPGAFVFLGTGEENFPYPIHHSCFDFNEDILPVGARLLARLAGIALSDV
jgi:amidohydrolase